MKLLCHSDRLCLNVTGVGSEHVHPDVISIPGGFGGYRYWMAFTPYLRGNDRIENPILRVSNDGYSWRAHEHVSDPIVGTPANPDTHNADTELVYDGNSLYLIYMTRNKRWKHTTFSYMTSSNGSDWSEPQYCFEGDWGVSPSAVKYKDTWRLWYVHLETDKRFDNSRVYMLSGQNLSDLRDRVACTMNIPGHIPWHIDIIRTGDLRYEALVAAFPRGTDTSRTCLYHMHSIDGMNFNLSSNCPIVNPTLLGWDNKFIYRSSFLKSGEDSYRIWYSAGSWSGHYGIGYLEGCLSKLTANERCEIECKNSISQIVPNMIGYMSYQLKNHLPEHAVNVLRGFKKAFF